MAYVRQRAVTGVVMYRNTDIGVRALQNCKHTTSYLEQYSADMLQCRLSANIFCKYAIIQVTVTLYSADMIKKR